MSAEARTHPNLIDDEENPTLVILVVNGTRRRWLEESISFLQLVNLAFDNNPPGGDPSAFSATFRNGPGGASGSLLYNETTAVTQGMIFDVTPTNKS